MLSSLFLDEEYLFNSEHLYQHFEETSGSDFEESDFESEVEEEEDYDTGSA